MGHKWLSVWTYPYRVVEGVSNPVEINCIAATGLREDGYCLWAKGVDAEDAVRNLRNKLDMDASVNFKSAPLTAEEMEQIVRIHGVGDNF